MKHLKCEKCGTNLNKCWDIILTPENTYKLVNFKLCSKCATALVHWVKGDKNIG